MGPNFGMRILSTPSSLSFTCTVVSLASTLSVSMAKLGYILPSFDATKGILRFTPSISGSVITDPTPAAFDSRSSTLAMMPGSVTILSPNCALTTADPGLRGVFLSLAPGMLPSITGLMLISSASILSSPALSGSGISTFHTTSPAPRPYRSAMRLAYSPRGHGHCPLASSAASSMLTTTTLFCVGALAVINVSKYRSLTLSTNVGSMDLTATTRARVRTAVQGDKRSFFIPVFMVCCPRGYTDSTILQFLLTNSLSMAALATMSSMVNMAGSSGLGMFWPLLI